MVVVDADGILDVDDLDSEVGDVGGAATEIPPGGSASLASLVGRPLQEIERMFIMETLQVAGGNREEAAGLLGIGERTLYRKIKEYHL
jgi:two-component system response regulator HydG